MLAIVVALCAVAALTLAPRAAPADAEDADAEIVERIERMARAGVPAGVGDLRPPEAPDPQSAYFRVAGQHALVGLLVQSAGSDEERRALTAAVARLEDALDAFGDPSVGFRAHGRRVFDEIARAQFALTRAALFARGGQRDAIVRARVELSDIAGDIAKTTVDAAARAGGNAAVLRRAGGAYALGSVLAAQGNHVLAVLSFGLGFAAAAGTIEFDVELFEQNIVQAVTGETVGYAYAIAVGGLLQSSDADGLARTDDDPPETSQSPTKEMFNASMTKTVSALALLKLLDDKGISVEASISGYLPSTWTQGANVDDITFRRLLTHRSGLDANEESCCSASGQTLAKLQEYIAEGSTGATDDQGSEYTNANYSLLRVLIPQIAFGEAAINELAGMFPLDAIYGGLYETYVTDTVFEPAGIAASRCASDEAEDARTLNYTSPNPTGPGDDPNDWGLTCGAAGWYMSAVELARLLAFVRFSDTIIDAETREEMDDLYLGWLDPQAFAAYVQSTLFPSVTFRGHGGDYVGVIGCMVNFHINVQASLVINSTGGDIGGHACQVLRDAFDSAWVAP